MSARSSAKATSVSSEPAGIPHLSHENVSQYIATMTRDLAKIARGEGYQTLAYVLEIAQLEAESLSGAGAPRRPGRGGDII